MFKEAGRLPEHIKTYAQCITQQKSALVGIFRGTVGFQLETLKKRILEGYERTGARDRAKDVALFFFYLVVRGNDISFVNSVLDADEIDYTQKTNQKV